MEKLTNLELVGVAYENDSKKAVLTFLDEERGEIREVNFNKQSYENNQFIDDPERAEKVEGWCQEHFGLTFDDLPSAIGVYKDVFVYENFNSLHEVEIPKKFDLDMVGQILEMVVVDIEEDGPIKIKLEYEDDVYVAKMHTGKFFPERKMYFVDPNKREKTLVRFEKTFNVPLEDSVSLIGKNVMVEVKQAGREHTWLDIKPLPKKK